jgi:DNA primase catalytic core
VHPALVADVAVWRAAMQVPDADQRPTGPRQLAKAAALWQQGLDTRLAVGDGHAMDEWAPALASVEPRLVSDPFAPMLAARLAGLSRAGLEVRTLLDLATCQGPLPDDHAAAALWWRISHHVEPAVAATASSAGALTAPWVEALVEHVGPERAEQVRSSQFWPALVTVVDHALQRGHRLIDLLDTTGRDTIGVDVDECHAMVWRISVRADPPGPDLDPLEPDVAPADLLDGVVPPADAPTPAEWQDFLAGHHEPHLVAAHDTHTTVDLVAARLRLDALVRVGMGLLDPSEAEIERMVERAHDWDDCPITRQRMVRVNALALEFYQAQYEHSWARCYLAARFGQDLAGHPDYRPGYAPAGWTRLVDHLRSLGVTDQELTVTGVAGMARTGRLIDRFRDRVVLPIIHDGDVLGFVGRRHPDRTDDSHIGPKYLNTPDTPLFHKGAQLYGALPHLRDAGAVPVLVEGPLDAIAVTLASRGSHVGVAPLGTALTEEQARQLLTFNVAPVVATDADAAGRRAAERAFWLLAQHGMDPTLARFVDGGDPASVLGAHGPAALTATLEGGQALGACLLEERLLNRPDELESLVAVVAAQPATTWGSSVQRIAAHTGTHPDTVRAALGMATRAWNQDPRRAVARELDGPRRAPTREGQSRGLPAERHTPEGVSAASQRLVARTRDQQRHDAAGSGPGRDVASRGR